MARNNANNVEVLYSEEPQQSQQPQKKSGLESFGEGLNNFFGGVGKALRRKTPEQGLIDEILVTTPMAELSARTNGAAEADHDIETIKDALDHFIVSKREELRDDLNTPSWGPKVKKRKFRRQAQGGKAGGLMSFGPYKDRAQKQNDRSMILEPNRVRAAEDEAIAFNLEQSRRYHQFLWIYLGAALASVAIVVAALSVDYSILKEFWHQAMMNEYMMVPPELQHSVGLKALQVLFATIGIHLVLRHMPDWVVTTFTALIFVMTVGMMISIGFLYAHKTLPVDNQATLSGENTEESGLLGALGEAGVDLSGGNGDEEQSSVVADAFTNFFSAEDLAFIDAVGWLVALTMVFLVVASIGALFMLWAEHNLNNFILAKEYKGRKMKTERLHMAERMALQIHTDGNTSSYYR